VTEKQKYGMILRVIHPIKYKKKKKMTVLLHVI